MLFVHQLVNCVSCKPDVKRKKTRDIHVVDLDFIGGVSGIKNRDQVQDGGNSPKNGRYVNYKSVLAYALCNIFLGRLRQIAVKENKTSD